MNEKIKPDADEKCPVCKGHGSLEFNYGVYVCPRCKGTGLKPAVETPQEQLKELRHKANQDWSTLGGQVVGDEVTHQSPSPVAEVQELLVEQLAKDIHVIGSSTIAWNLVDEGWHDDRRKIAKWHLSELTTKLAALKSESRRLKNSITTLSYAKGGLENITATLRAENQGLVKEVERLRDELNQIIDYCNSDISYNAKDVSHVEYLARKALKPTT